MIPLQENGAQAACATRDDFVGLGAATTCPPTTPPIEAQAAYQIALDCLRSHRNRWKASAADAGPIAEPQA